MPSAKEKTLYALKTAVKISSWTWMFCRVSWCGNHRAMHTEPPLGIQKNKVHFSDSSTSALPKYQSQEACQEQIFHHFIPICSVNQIKRARWTFRAKSRSHHSSQWKMLKKGKELMWGEWDRWREGKLLEMWFRGFPWAVDNSSRFLQCLVCTSSTHTAVTSKNQTWGSNRYHHVLVPPWHYTCG